MNKFKLLTINCFLLLLFSFSAHSTETIEETLSANNKYYLIHSKIENNKEKIVYYHNDTLEIDKKIKKNHSYFQLFNFNNNDYHFSYHYEKIIFAEVENNHNNNEEEDEGTYEEIVFNFKIDTELKKNGCEEKVFIENFRNNKIKHIIKLCNNIL